MGNIKHMERIHEHIHLMVQGKKKKSKCQDGKVACSKKIASRYDGDFWATTWFMIQYWFYGLSYITFSGPILAFTMPVQAIFFLADARLCLVPSPIPLDSGVKMLQLSPKCGTGFQ